MVKEILLKILLCLPLYLLLRLFVFLRNRGNKSWGREAAMLLFYMTIVATLVVTGITPLSGFHTDIRLETVNLTPFFSIGNILKSNARNVSFINIVGNVVLFMPFGFFMPFIWRCNRLFSTVLQGALFSLLIECAQLFLIRSTDIDDLILNTLGTFIGYAVFFVVSRVVPTARVSTERGGILMPWCFIFIASGCLITIGFLWR